MKNIIFDLDGTLADTSADLIAAANACFLGMGLKAQLDPVKDAKTAFAGGRAMLRLGFSRLDSAWDETTIDQHFSPFIEYYRGSIDTYTTLYPNVGATLELLKSQGYQLGICTNKPVGLAETLVQNLGIRPMFSALLGADSLAVRKPDRQHLLQTIADVGGSPARSVLIGDTVTDRDAAKNADVPCVLVTFGPDGQGVLDLKPEAVLDHYDDLPGLMNRMIG